MTVLSAGTRPLRGLSLACVPASGSAHVTPPSSVSVSRYASTSQGAWLSPSLFWVPPVSGVPESQESGDNRAIVTVTGALPCSVFSFMCQRLVLRLGNRGIAWHVAVLVTHWESWGVRVS